jgi:hypothetical protein
MKSKSLTSFALASTLALASVSSLHAATILSDDASNYGGGWNTGSNGGSGFGAWTLNSSNGSGGFGGTFISSLSNTDHPLSVGITGMANTSFALYANATGSDAFASASRNFANPLGVGDSFSFQWGINWESGSAGNKGFNIFAGPTKINVNNGGSPVITVNGNDVGFGYGTNAMTWNLTRTTATNLQVDATNRTGGTAYSGNFTIADAPTGFEFYASNMQSGNEAQPYFNDLTLTVVPEPSSLSLLALSGLALLRRRRA